ncbi:eukaryotic aspartyl protease family [Trichoderma arundinaceum]|uniref:Eukaryotic aspartyl protease family n=1 Tax=Trichoderma arundinaceum TaxID=490622 RepID=A0A395NEA3_TRIAR|nr:eukaryotic aspartyl protease family [Trichoderma arundinaceum]
MRFDALVIAAAAGIAYANDPAPVAFDAGEWLGIDGNWSTIKVLLGSNSDLVNVLLSTSLSEFWAVGPGGCLKRTDSDLIEEPHCTASRGGIYTPFASKHWSYMGIWQLGLEYLGYGGNGQYGLDTVNAYSTITDIGFGMSNVLMSTINTTDYYIGLLGLGITQGTFGHEVAQSPLTQAVHTFGWIPSYSYGYTAGASYRNIPVSITLGGYDTARYVPHDIDFTLTPQDNMPRALVRGIEASANNGTARPKKWESGTASLSGWDNSFTALIDSTTPYLWLPNAVCDQFADAFNLTYNKTFDLYTLTNEQYNKYGSSDSFTFTFSFSSFDNHDNFGSPLNVPGLVNITVPMRAFVSLLQYPFMHRAIKYGDPAVPYFALRRSQNDSAIVIGRSFLQEAYLITKYDEAVFSVHQAKFPQRPIGDANLMPINQPNNSPYPGPPKPTSAKLNTGQMVGIAAGAILLCLFCVLSVYCLCHRRKLQEKGDEVAIKETKDCASTLVPDTPRIPKPAIFSKFTRRKRLRSEGKQFSNTAVLSHFTEAPDSEIYELPAPMAPVELDASDGDDDGSIIGDSLPGTDDTMRSFSAYEVARRKIDRQLQGPVPEYSPPLLDIVPPQEKETSYTARAAYTESDKEITPISPIKSGSGTGSLPGSLPSPISSGSGYNSHPDNTLYPATVSVTDQSSDGGSGCQGGQNNEDDMRGGANRLSSRRSQSQGSPYNNYTSSASVACQKTPIDPTNIVCLGNLPENLQSLRHSIMLAHIVSQENQDSVDSFTPRFNAEFHLSEQSLGSNYTEEEDRIMQEMTRQATFSFTRSQGDPSTEQAGERGQEQPSNQDTDQPNSLKGEERIDGNDIIHIPQMAEKRYSWED